LNPLPSPSQVSQAMAQITDHGVFHRHMTAVRLAICGYPARAMERGQDPMVTVQCTGVTKKYQSPCKQEITIQKSKAKTARCHWHKVEEMESSSDIHA
jgi:hypothetical protein